MRIATIFFGGCVFFKKTFIAWSWDVGPCSSWQFSSSLVDYWLGCRWSTLLKMKVAWWFAAVQTAPPLGSLSGGGGTSNCRLSEVKIWKRENGYGRAMVTWCNVLRFWCFRILQCQLVEKQEHGEWNHWARVIAWCRFRGKFVLQSMPDHDSNISCWGTSYRATYTMFQAAVGWLWSSVRVSCEGLEH